MKYLGQFADIDNNSYYVQIITNNNQSVTQEITLSTSPFTTEMDTSDENIYKPVKYTGATVGIVTRNESDYMFDVYSGEAKGTSIKLYNNRGVMLWGGFATPVIYNNGYTQVHEILEIEAIDGLSILQYYKYSSNNKQIKSFVDIIRFILAKCDVYTTFFVSASNKLNASDSDSLIENLYISEQNFFDEKDSDETDNDVAWTCKEVLEEICQYLGLVCVAEGDSVYFLDYDAILNGHNNYFRYTINGGKATSVTLSGNIAVDGSMFRGADSNISLDNVYNKVSVKDDFYKFENIIPDIYDTALNVTKSSDPTLQSSTNINNGMYGEVVQGTTGNMEGDTNNNMICMIDRVYDPEEEEYTEYNAVFVKYFNHPNYIFYAYNNSDSSSLNYTDTKSFYGAVIAKFDVKKMDANQSWWDILAGNINARTLDEWLAKNQISTVSFTNYIMMLNPTGNNHISNTNITSYPYFKTVSSDATALFGGDNAYLVLQGSYMYHYMSEDPYPIPENEIDIAEGRYAIRAGQTYFIAKLKWGNKYWNGTEWTTTNTTFQIPYMRDDSSSGDRRADATMYKNIDFVNTVTWRIGTNEKGVLIPLPENKIMSGMPELTVYKPFDPEYYSTSSGDSEGQHYKHSVVFLKNFAIKAVIGDPTYSDVNNSNTVYTNIINDQHVQDLKEITFKICTNDNKNPNYSSVAYKDNNEEYNFLTGIYNDAMTNNGVIDYDGNTSNGTLRPEEWLIYRLTKQYSEPKIRLELELNTRYMPYNTFTDKWLPNKTFIVDSQSTNYYTGQTTITLVEKG